MGSVVLVVAEALLSVSDISVFVFSLLSFSLSNYSGPKVVQHASSLGLLGICTVTKLINKPAHKGINGWVTC